MRAAPQLIRRTPRDTKERARLRQVFVEVNAAHNTQAKGEKR